MFQEGDIVEIPLPGGDVAIGWILHVSKRFKDAVGFIVFGIKGQLRNENIEDHPSLKVLGPLYTHIAALEHYGWKMYAHQPLTETKRQLTKRRVGGDVYLGDDYVGSVEELGEQNLAPMLVMGMPVVYIEIEKAFGENGPST